MNVPEILGWGVLAYLAFLGGSIMMGLLSHVLGIDRVWRFPGKGSMRKIVLLTRARFWFLAPGGWIGGFFLCRTLQFLAEDAAPPIKKGSER